MSCISIYRIMFPNLIPNLLPNSKDWHHFVILEVVSDLTLGNTLHWKGGIVSNWLPKWLGVQISGNFAPGYPELFFEWVPGTRIFVMFPKITLKRASRHPGSGPCWHTSMNSLDLLWFTMQHIRTVPNSFQKITNLPHKFRKSFHLWNQMYILHYQIQ